MPNRPQEDALLTDIAMSVVPLLPGGWELASLTYAAVGGSYERVTMGGGLVARRRVGEHNPATATKLLPAVDLLPRAGTLDLLRRLRAGCHEEGRGTWSQVTVDVRPPLDGRPLWGVQYVWPDSETWSDEISWEAEVPPAACAEELRLFPRPEALIPAWMREPLALHGAAAFFDPGGIARRPQDERALTASLPDGLGDLFPKARSVLAGLVPAAAGRFLVGRLADGCWSVIRQAGAWLAVRQEDGACAHVVPFRAPRAAVAHAMGGVMADAGLEVNAGVLQQTGLLHRQIVPSRGEDAWLLGEEGRRLSARTRGAARPAAGSYVALDPLHNRPGGYFACTPGPAPERGPFVSVHEVFERLAGRSGLPAAPPPPPDEPVRTPTETLPAGTELDAYGATDRDVLFTIGTPFRFRGVYGTAEGLPYHVYRLRRPLVVTPGLFATTPIFSGDAPPEDEPEGRGFHLYATIADLLASGHIVEITGESGHAPPPGTTGP